MTDEYTLPPEWAPQQAILINWPHVHSEWWDPIRDEANHTYTQLVKALALTQTVMIICFDSKHREEIQKHLLQAKVNLPRVGFFIIPSNDVWTRDYGPISLMSGKALKLVKFQFNGWGNKYPAEMDNQVLIELFDQNFVPQAQLDLIDFTLEGGSIEVDGQGALLTTKKCLLSKTRNPGYDQNQIEKTLKNSLNVNCVLWLEHGYIAGDDTDGHIDTLARFVNEETICHVRSDDSTDEHFHQLKEMQTELKLMKNHRGLPYQLVSLPSPAPIFSIVDGRRLPATYANFLIANKVIVLPYYNDPQDKVAHAILQQCFPNREVIGVPSRSLIENYGSIHCITMQIPI